MRTYLALPAASALFFVSARQLAIFVAPCPPSPRVKLPPDLSAGPARERDRIAPDP